jgi:hypothetical protein
MRDEQHTLIVISPEGQHWPLVSGEPRIVKMPESKVSDLELGTVAIDLYEAAQEQPSHDNYSSFGAAWFEEEGR